MYRLSNRSDIVKRKIHSETGIGIEMLENGSIFSINHDEIMINQILGSPVETQISNVYLRVFETTGIKYYPLIGSKSNGAWKLTDHGFYSYGIIDHIEYRCELVLSNNSKSWQYVVTVNNKSNDIKTIDCIYAQDVGLANEGAVRTNELYTSHYIDQRACQHEKIGPVVMFRQNQKQNNLNPWLMMGCLSGATGYSTDGYQFYGLDYKTTGVPKALVNESLDNKVYQYEFALGAIQSKKVELNCNEITRINFFALFKENHQDKTTERDLKFIDEIECVNYEQVSHRDEINNDNNELISCFNDLYNSEDLFQSEDLTSNEIDQLFSSDRRHEEKIENKLLAFFYDNHKHVVLKEKERHVERTHGHIIRSGKSLLPNDRQLSVTSWMNGIFTSHVTVGNTNFNKMISVLRNGLNVLKSSGQRIFVKHNGLWQLLGTPSAFEMGINYARWIYKCQDKTIEVRVWTSTEHTAGYLNVMSLNGNAIEFKILTNLLCGDLEYANHGQVEINESTGTILLKPDKNEMVFREYPFSSFGIAVLEREKLNQIYVEKVKEDLILPYVCHETKSCLDFKVVVTGDLESSVENVLKNISLIYQSWDNSLKTSDKHYDMISKNIKLTHPDVYGIEKLNDLLPWYIHNAFVHLTSPHGLEQYSGAAWGLRDVCQGPIELLLSIDQYDVIKDLLQIIYGKQIKSTGDWRQWFMFDRFYDIQDSSSHNDIIVWPLKGICDYIEATNDFSILNIEVDYIDAISLKSLDQPESIKKHIDRQIEKMTKDTIEGTSLIRYGHGDWEDTLQPSNDELRENLVSPWTVALVYENINRYIEILRRLNDNKKANTLENYCASIKRDFNQYLIKDGVVTGLGHFDKGCVNLIIHPSSEIVGPKYRLIPMNRGIISGLFSKEQMKKHLEIIDEQLTFVDGVHLMEKPLVYNGGLETYFKRAETGANFGREIGLQYIHAHIRYLQVLAYSGDGEQLFDGLEKINPIGITDVISTASKRQSNCYYSSSDAAFMNRYDAYDHIDDINNKNVAIKGGWRIYSSGPGIFLSQVVMNFLGIRHYFDKVLIDPVIPVALDELSFSKDYNGKRIKFVYYAKENNSSPKRIIINGNTLACDTLHENPYRQGGVLFDREEFDRLLTEKENILEIYL